MKKFLIVYAHPEPKSFCGAIKNITHKKLTELGNEVKISDLYAQKFNPVATKEDFNSLKNKEFFQFIQEQKNSYENNFKFYSEEIQTELDKIKWADNLIFIFPLWWGSYPAIMKGWMDKCLVWGHSWTSENTNENGLLKGKSAMGVVTCEAPKENFTPEGGEGVSMDELLHHFTETSMGFTGMKVYKTYPFYRIGRIDLEERIKRLNEYEKALENFENFEVIVGGNKKV